MIPETNEEKLDFVINELCKLKMYFEGQTKLIESYINDVKSKLKHVDLEK